MSNSWSTMSGDEVTQIITKGSSPNWQGFSYQNSGLLFVTSENVRDGFLDISEPKYLSKDFGKKAKNSALQHGDVLINIVGASIGRACLFELQGVEANVNQAVCVFRLKSGFDPRFFLYYFQSPDVLRRLLGQTSDSARPNLSLTDFREFLFEVPCLAEQRKIAEILRTWDDAIEACEGLIEKLMARQQALVHQLVFGGRRLGNYARSKELQKARWLTVPTDWPVVKIGSIAEERSEFNRDGNAAEVLSCSKYDGFVRSLEYFKKQVFSSDLSGYKVIRRGDFGFPSNHVEEGSIGLQDLVDEGLVSPIYTIFRFDSERVDNDYAYSVLKTELYRHIFRVSTSASVDRRGSLRWSDFSTLPFPLPHIDEQREIQKVLAAGQLQIDRQQVERDALTRQKRGLMQKLLTGEWRVKLQKEAAA